MAPDLDAPQDLKFDPSVPDGVGKQIKKLNEVGSGNVKTVETGKAETYSLNVDDFVRQRNAKGGKLQLVIVTADGAVAATCFGAGDEITAHRPMLAFVLPR